MHAMKISNSLPGTLNSDLRQNLFPLIQEVLNSTIVIILPVWLLRNIINARKIRVPHEMISSCAFIHINILPF